MKQLKDYMTADQQKLLRHGMRYIGVAVTCLLINYFFELSGFSDFETGVLYTITTLLGVHFLLMSFSLRVPDRENIKIATKKKWGIYLKDRRGNQYYLPYLYWLSGLKTYVEYIKSR